MAFVFAIAALVWVVLAIGFVRHVLALRTLPPAGGEPARVSVIVAARDEAARIEGTVRRILAQRGVEIQVIVVDDRSTDARGLAGEVPRQRGRGARGARRLAAVHRRRCLDGAGAERR